MKYELNTPYEFEVKNIVNDNDTPSFEVEIGDSLFPVKAYPEQIQGNIPPIISCRIVLDKNKNAYLVQNEAFCYPFIYKPNHRYIFEVIDIKDEYIVLQDKHGIIHTMPKDGASYYLNEIIVKCVEIVNDNNFKAHLIFKDSYPIVETTDEETVEIQATSDKPKYAPTVFIEDPMPPVHKETDKNEIGSAGGKNLSVSTMLLTKDWDNLKLYLEENLKGREIPRIQQEVAVTIEKLNSSSLYWSVVRFLLHFDAHLFLATIANANISNITDISENISYDTINDIIDDAFLPTDKTKHAIILIKPFRHLLTPLQKDYIKKKCANLTEVEAFYNLFKSLNLSPDSAVKYLLTLEDNIAAAYTIYKFYLDGKNGRHINENSSIPSFRPSVIANHCSMMSKSKSYAFQVSSNLISSRILEKRGSCPPYILEELSKNGFEGFKSIIARKRHKEETKKILTSFSAGDELSELNFIREIDNYYLLVEPKTGSHALLVKELTEIKPSNKKKSKAKIIKTMANNGKTIFIVSQKIVPPTFAIPPLVNQYTILELGFTEFNGLWYPEVRKYSKLLKILIEPRPRNIDFKKRYKAQIIEQKDFFTFVVKLMK